MADEPNHGEERHTGRTAYGGGVAVRLSFFVTSLDLLESWFDDFGPLILSDIFGMDEDFCNRSLARTQSSIDLTANPEAFAGSTLTVRVRSELYLNHHNIVITG